MRTAGKAIVLAVLSTIQLSCGTVDPLMTMTGETATVRLRDGNEHCVELLAVGDSSIVCLPTGGNGSLAPGRVAEIPVSSVSVIEVSGFRNDRWVGGVIFFQVLPAIGLAGAAASVHADAGAVFAVTIIPAFVTTILYAASGVPTPTFESPLEDKDLNELRKYARFGGKLTPTQKEHLLRSGGQ